MRPTPRSTARLRPFRPVPFGRYTLLSALSSGGMGELFLARREEPHGGRRLCVVKKILPAHAQDTDFVQRFVGEARTLGTLSHPSIARVIDSGLHQGKPYIAIEYVDGKDVRKIQARASELGLQLPLKFTLWMMSHVLEALAHVHMTRDKQGNELGLVHRDVSPANIMVSYRGEVKLIDFGLAKSRMNPAQTNPSVILGKFLYMSPEQARHAPVDARSDVFSVGMCLYELISGRNPNENLDAGDAIHRMLSPQIEPLSSVAPHCPGAVATTVMRALSVEPARRFQSASEFAAALRTCEPQDPDVLTQDLGAFVRKLFSTEYETERRLLAVFREKELTNGDAVLTSGDDPITGEFPAPELPRGAAQTETVIHHVDRPVRRSVSAVVEHDRLVTPTDVDVSAPSFLEAPVKKSGRSLPPRAWWGLVVVVVVVALVAVLLAV